MAYTKVNDPWADRPNLSTPVNAAALDHIEQGIADAADTADDALALATAAGGAASTTAAGISELATSAETITGTDTARAVTPAGLKAVTDIISPWAHGVLPKVTWNGSSWPSRSSIVPTGYTGAVEYFSPWDAAATDPADRATNDLWTRVV